MSQKPILVGGTVQCLQHLYQDRPRSQRLALDRLLGSFCGVAQETVHQWQPSFESLRGPSLLRARCFLRLAGYEVAELQGMREPARSLALIVGLKVIDDPYEVQRLIGFEVDNRSGLNSLYRIVIRNEGFSSEVAERMAALVKEHHAELGQAIKDRGHKVRAGLKRLAADKPAAPIQWGSADEATTFDPNNVTAFWRAVGLTVALGSPMASNPEAIAMLKGLSAGSPELYELRDLLNKLLAEWPSL